MANHSRSFIRFVVFFPLLHPGLCMYVFLGRFCVENARSAASSWMQQNALNVLIMLKIIKYISTAIFVRNNDLT